MKLKPFSSLLGYPFESFDVYTVFIQLGVFVLKGVRILLLLLSGLFLQVSIAQTADIKIGVVSIGKILNEAPQAEAANKRLEREFAPREKGLVDAQRDLRQLEERLNRDSAVMSDNQRRDLEREIIAQRRELKRSTDEFREDVNLRRNEELGKFQRQIMDVINNLARDEGFDLIVNEGAVLHMSNRVDITDKVLQRLSSTR